MTTTWWHITDLGWLYQRAALPIIEIESVRASELSKPIFPLSSARGLIDDSRVLQFRPWTLADALVRSSVTEAPGVFHRVELGLGAWLRFRGLLGLDGNDCLTVDPERLLLLRDSMWTATSGELGQAICWLMGIRSLGCRQLVDFGLACRTLGRPEPGKDESRPDYLGLCGNDRKLLESKGHLAADGTRPSAKTDLREALDQCWEGVKRLRPYSVASCHAIVTSLHPAGSAEPSRIFMADPEGDGGEDPSPEQEVSLMRLHYAAWATAAGALELSRLLLSGDTADRPGRGFVTELAGRAFFFPFAGEEASPRVAFQPLPPELYPLPSLEGLVRGVDLNLLKTLTTSRTAASRFQNYPDPEDFRDQPGVVEVLPDGTALVSAEHLHGARQL